MSPQTPPDNEDLPDVPEALAGAAQRAPGPADLSHGPATLDELLAGWAAATVMSASTADAMAAAITATPAPVMAAAREPDPAEIRRHAAWWRQHQRDLARTFLRSNGITAA